MQFATIPHLPNCRNSMESINLAKAIIEGYLIFIISTCVTSNNFIFFLKFKWCCICVDYRNVTQIATIPHLPNRSNSVGWRTQVRYARTCRAAVDAAAHASVTIFFFFFGFPIRFETSQYEKRKEKK